MAKSKSRKKGRKSRRPTKAEIKRQKSTATFYFGNCDSCYFFFAIARLGIFGITVYNIRQIRGGKFGLLPNVCGTYLFDWI